MDLKEIKQKRLRRHTRVRAKIKGTADRPRMSVFRSNKHLMVQLIDDAAGRTIAAASDYGDLSRRGASVGSRVAAGALLGAMIAKKAQENKITKAVFDRGAYRYHGMVRAIADAARKGGLDF
ncbi:MAG: 50S ribosomal protein L18 [Candidatus Sungiibacteriota bacterium]